MSDVAVLAPARSAKPRTDRDPLLRLLALTRPAWPRLALAVLTGFGGMVLAGVASAVRIGALPPVWPAKPNPQ